MKRTGSSLAILLVSGIRESTQSFKYVTKRQVIACHFISMTFPVNIAAQSLWTKFKGNPRVGTFVRRGFILLLGCLSLLTMATQPASAQPFAYVTNYGANTVSVIDIATNTVVDTVGVGVNPAWVAITPAPPAAIVVNTNDSGPGSLREAIEDANIEIGPSTIIFNIPTSDPGFNGTVFTIQPLSALPALTDNGTFIDGSSQTAFTGDTNPVGPEIVINGSLIPGIEEVDGLVVESANNRIHSLVINGFPGPCCGGNGISIRGPGASGNIITGCFIGIDFTGTVAVPNADNGISIAGGATNNVVGGTMPEARNVISGNAVQGVAILDAGTRNNTVRGNFIGTDVHGSSPIGNMSSGVFIGINARNNIVGGTNQGEGNLISGNGNWGVEISTGSDSNLVQGNFIGTDSSGTIALGNAGGVITGGPNNLIGGTQSGARNIISGNQGTGVVLLFDDTGNNATGNLVQGNFIGTDVTGINALGNQEGIVIVAPDNVIGGTETGARNVISGNEDIGVVIVSTYGTGNVVLGNYIGTDVTGTNTLGNGGDGVVIFQGATANSIGDGTVAGRNIISGNVRFGVSIATSDANGNIVQGNYIGTDVTGTDTLGNDIGGVLLISSDNVVGGLSPGEGNLISGNSDFGILVLGVEAAQTATSPVVGGDSPAEVRRSLLSHQDKSGIPDNVLRRIAGLRRMYTGEKERKNMEGFGVRGIAERTRKLEVRKNVKYPKRETIIDGLFPLLSPKSQTIGADRNQILGNLIGTDASGTFAIPNDGLGILIVVDASGTVVSGNVISSNGLNLLLADPGVSNTRITGNLIGTSSSGTTALPGNGLNILIVSGPHDNVIGGSSPEDRNIISGSQGWGIGLLDGVTNNRIMGNYIGTDITGMFAIPNGASTDSMHYPAVLLVLEGVQNNQIGGIGAGEGNLISGNQSNAIAMGFGAESNEVQGNIIGLNVADEPLGNGFHPVTTALAAILFVDGATKNLVGGFEPGAPNVIAYNARDGVHIRDDSTLYNTIFRNSIYNNDSLGIRLTDGGNGGIASPALTSVSENKIVGTAPPLSLVDVFADSAEEGQHQLGTVQVDALGNFVFEWVFPQGLNINATATDPDGNTSEFAFLTDSVPPGPSPITGDIPDVTFLEDSTHTTLDLDAHVIDSDDDLTELKWSVSGNDSVIVVIDSLTHEVIFSAPANWNGQEVLTFIVTDPDSNSDSDEVTVVVVPVNDPPSIVGLLQPTAGTAVSPDSIQFVWTPAEDPDLYDTTGYNLYYTLDPDFVMFTAVTGLGDTTYAELSGLITNEVYYWRVGAVDIEEQETFSSIDSFSTVIVGVEPGTEQAIPTTYELSQNYPNPFNPETVIRYALPKSSDVSLVIYNIMGQEIIRWDQSNVQPGYYEKTWNGTNHLGVQVSSGIYIYRILAGEYISVRKMVLLK